MSRAKGSNAIVAPSQNHWEQEEDVRALARAHAIKKDPERHKRALLHAKTMKGEHERRAAESKAIVDMANKPSK